MQKFKPSTGIVNQLSGRLEIQLRDQLWDQLRYKLWDQLRNQLWDQLRNQLWDQLGDQLEDQKLPPKSKRDKAYLKLEQALKK